jgi:hypothetical protein
MEHYWRQCLLPLTIQTSLQSKQNAVKAQLCFGVAAGVEVVVESHCLMQMLLQNNENSRAAPQEDVTKMTR